MSMTAMTSWAGPLGTVYFVRGCEQQGLPFMTETLGTPVGVERVDLNDAEEIRRSPAALAAGRLGVD
jgi:hypothetical protein